ncbi:MAG: hypothetical protein HYR85_12320 [Planctomycetes bacterium]|nr:hypothetical protein [Planctomycetota bacterium]
MNEVTTTKEQPSGRPRRRLWVAALGCFLVGAIVGGAAVGIHAQSAPPKPAPRATPRRSSKEILDEFAANPSPGFALDMNSGEFDALLRQRLGKQCELALELWEDYPRHAALGRLLFARWMNLVNFFGEPARVRSETMRLLAQRPPGTLAALAKFVNAQASIRDGATTWDDARADVEQALSIEREPRDAQGWKCSLLLDLARCRTADPKLQRELAERALIHARCDEQRADVRVVLALLDRIGQPIDLEFDDALDGRHVKFADLRGRCVLLHVWSPTDPDATHRSLAPLEPELRAAHATVVTIDPLAPADGRATEITSARALGVRSPFFVDRAPFDDTWAYRFGLRGVPHLLLVAPDGRLTAAVTSPLALVGRLAAPKSR